MSLFQSNLRKQIRNLPKILNFVKKIHYYSELFTSLLGDESYRGGFRIQERRGRAAGRGHGSSQPAYECDRSQVYRDHPVGHH